jgi:Zn finger protein HypA/HybF involved in hydrogenase expression
MAEKQPLKTPSRKRYAVRECMVCRQRVEWAEKMAPCPRCGSRSFHTIRDRRSFHERRD